MKQYKMYIVIWYINITLKSYDNTSQERSLGGGSGANNISGNVITVNIKY